MKYWDSSALVPLLVDEGDASDSARAMLDEDPGIATWLLSPLEVDSALWRRHRTDDLTQEALDAARRGLAELEPSWTVVTDVGAVMRRARRLLGAHPLRAADSLQLAAALVLCSEQPRRIPFVAFDARLAGAARREGFQVMC